MIKCWCLFVRSCWPYCVSRVLEMSRKSECRTRAIHRPLVPSLMQDATIDFCPRSIPAPRVWTVMNRGGEMLAHFRPILSRTCFIAIDWRQGQSRWSNDGTRFMFILHFLTVLYQWVKSIKQHQTGSMAFIRFMAFQYPADMIQGPSHPFTNEHLLLRLNTNSPSGKVYLNVLCMWGFQVVRLTCIFYICLGSCPGWMVVLALSGVICRGMCVI